MKITGFGLLACFAATISGQANLLFVDVVEGQELAQAQLLNASATVVSTTEWGQMTAQEFAAYDTIIIGDPGCGEDPALLDFMSANSDVWGPVVTGNIIVIGASFSLQAMSF